MSDPATRLIAARAAIEGCARRAGRDPAAVRLIAVTKGRSVEEIMPLLDAGHRDFGENRVQEAAGKWPQLLARHPDLRLHMIGRLQSNKAAEAAALFHAIHSLDRPSLLEALRKAGWAGETYVQVNVGDEAQKGGVPLADLPQFLDQLRAASLAPAGLMAIPPAAVEAGPFFALLAKLARRHGVTRLSMGMSSDYETAVMLGATDVRIGSALFG